MIKTILNFLFVVSILVASIILLYLAMVGYYYLTE